MLTKAGKQGKITVWDCHSEVTTALLAANAFSEVVNISSVDIIAKSEALSTLLKDEKQCWFAQTKAQNRVHKWSQMLLILSANNQSLLFSAIKT